MTCKDYNKDNCGLKNDGNEVEIIKKMNKDNDEIRKKV
jgi:hypothetical protein